ncbi:MAG: alpha/beta hydrolase [Croceibacterium sp.]
MAEHAWTDGEWKSADGLVLRYRDYPGPSDRPPLLCLPGLTRNARDFAALAETLSPQWRVLCVDLRGRGQSDYAKDPATYNPLQYVADLQRLFEVAGLDRVVAVGTSLGGVVAMLLAAMEPERLAGAVLNDIGPDIEAVGLARIRDHVGQGRSFETWMHAARGLKEQAGAFHPTYEIADWLNMAKRLMVLGNNGRIAFDYDMKIAEPFNDPPPDPPVDMWPAFRALAGRPVLALRGALSDILSPATLQAMKRELPGMAAVTIPKVGHAPALDEPAALRAILRLLEDIR